MLEPSSLKAHTDQSPLKNPDSNKWRGQQTKIKAGECPSFNLRVGGWVDVGVEDPLGSAAKDTSISSNPQARQRGSAVSLGGV